MARVFEGLAQFSRFVESLAVVSAVVPSKTVEDVALLGFGRALLMYGDSTKLRSLTPATQAERVSLGFTPNDPLKRTGGLQSELEFEHSGDEAGYGSPDPIQLYHEVGYVNARTGQLVEPRPLLRISAQETAAEGWVLVQAAAAKMVGK